MQLCHTFVGHNNHRVAMVSELVPLNQLDCEIVAICYNAGGLKPASLKKKYSKFCPLLSNQSQFYKSSTSLFCTSDSHLTLEKRYGQGQ